MVSQGVTSLWRVDVKDFLPVIISRALGELDSPGWWRSQRRHPSRSSWHLRRQWGRSTWASSARNEWWLIGSQDCRNSAQCCVHQSIRIGQSWYCSRYEFSFSFLIKNKDGLATFKTTARAKRKRKIQTKWIRGCLIDIVASSSRGRASTEWDRL